MRIAVDTGGTFTDLVVEDESGELRLFKSPTTVGQPVRGILACADLAAAAFGQSRKDLLGSCEMFIHGTTRAINAILTGTTARTAFITTQGHRDILLFREGGRTQPFNHRREYPDPYVPRRLTYEIEERIGPDGEVLIPLAEDQVREVIDQMKGNKVEAIGVCLLWSPVNPAHELEVGRLIEELMPGVPVTLSHRLNPSIREYRRASSTCIDASLKPVMDEYLGTLASELRKSGFSGRLLMVSSAGGAMDARDVREAPIHSLGSGPAMAPVAGRFYAAADDIAEPSVIVTDAGGTSFDVSLVRGGAIPWTRETWLREEFSGYITGFPSVDVRSIGAGGGSIAWVDDGGLLHVGPQSAGSEPGPACYARGGSSATVTDACVVLGLLDPDFFLGGSIPLDPEAASQAVERNVGQPLGLGTVEAASAVLTVATEQMVRAIEETTVYRGVDPAEATLVGGGGAAGFNIAAIARRLGCRAALVPLIGPGLSAAGALLSDLLADYVVTSPTGTTSFAFDIVNEVLEQLRERCAGFGFGSDANGAGTSIQLFAEARYPDQVWELEVPLAMTRFNSMDDVERFRSDFHAAHQAVFGVADPDSPVEILTWRARVTCNLGEHVPRSTPPPSATSARRTRRAFFDDRGWESVPVFAFEQLPQREEVPGPALIESPQTTIVVDPGSVATRSMTGSVLINPAGAEGQEASVR